jgi:hypothetical protein
MLRCLEIEFLSHPRVVLPFPQFALLHSLTCVHLRLITILGNFCDVAIASFFGVPSSYGIETLIMSDVGTHMMTSERHRQYLEVVYAICEISGVRACVMKTDAAP